MNVKINDFSKENQQGVQKYKLTIENVHKITNNFYIVDRGIKAPYIELYNGFENDFFELDEPRFERIAISESIQEAQKELKKYIEKFYDDIDYKIEHLMSNGYTNQEIIDNIDKTMNYPLPPF